MDWVKSNQRLLLLAGVGVAVAWLVLQGAGRAPMPATDVVQAVQPAARVDAPERSDAPQVDMTRLAQRTAKKSENDLFVSRDWRPPAPPKAAPPPAPPQEAPIPPVPYTYLGRWTENAGKGTVVVLGREGRSYLVRAHDVLEATWRIDAIEPARIVLTYLPRDAVQVIAIAQQGAAPAALALQVKPVDTAQADAVLQVAVPERAAIGDEITVRVTLDPRKTVHIEHGAVEVRYDPSMLNLAGRNAAAGPDPGRVQLDVAGGFLGHGGPPATARLRVVATGPATTQITFANLNATDSEARAVAVSIDGPNPLPLTIVRSQK